MATLASPGSQLAVSQINALKSRPNTNTNITTREQDYMGGNPARPSSSGVCMPNDVLTSPWYDPVNNPAGKALNFTSDWTYTGPGVGGTWSPTSISEFGGAYNNPPQVVVTVAAAGGQGLWPGGSLRDSCFRTLTFSQGTGSYFYATAQNAGGSPAWSGWVSAGGSSVGPTQIFGLNTPTAYVWAAVRDSNNCGTGFDLNSFATYP